MRKKIKDNLSEEQRDFIKEVKTEFPKNNLRIRQEDKGHRFVIADGDAEDVLIEETLGNLENYREQEDNPIDTYNAKIDEYAARSLREGEISEKQARFISNQQKNPPSHEEEELHLANPQPKYKTHKKDEAGNMLDPVPIRTITVGSVTPVHRLSELCSKAIQHLVTPEHLPNMSQSTKAVVKRLFFINENHTPLSPQSVFAFSDIHNMYPSVDNSEALEIIKDMLENDPSPLGASAEYITEGLKLCGECNCVQFKEKFYVPCKGCAQGPCHACSFTDIWVSRVVKRHIETSNIDSVLYSIYRDDGKDILVNGLVDQPAYQQHLDSLHPNLNWDLTCGKAFPAVL